MTMTALIVITLKFSIALNIFVLGLSATYRDATHVFRKPNKFLRAFVSMNVIMPLVAVALALVLDLNQAARVILVALSLSPVPPVLPRKALKAGGHENYAVGLLVAASVVAIVFIPLAVELIERVFGVPLQMPALAVATILVPYLLVPLALGMAVRAVAPAMADRLIKPVGMVAIALLVLSALPILLIAGQSFRSVIGDGTLVAFVAFALAGLAAGHLLGGPDPEDRTVLALYSSARHPGVAIAIAQVNFPELNLALAAALLALIVAAIVSAPYLQWTKRHAVRVRT
jgi:BASS family bile acid:Na+ symporter